VNRAEELSRAWMAARPRSVRIAYAVLGSTAEAEDVVGDCWLRLMTADAADPIRDVEAWATVAVARAALDTLRSARHRRETYTGPWLPEPVLEPLGDPADRVTLDETVGYALLVVLETLSPAERTAYVLHELFAVPFPEVAETVGRSPAAVRQLAARARAHIAAGAPRLDVDAAQHRAVVGRFIQAAAGGDMAALLGVLDPDALFTSDGGGVVSAARRPVQGADRVSRMILGLMAKPGPADRRVQPLLVNGLLGLAVFENGGLVGVFAFTVVGDRIIRIDSVRAPAKLPALDAG
jgi:RNA polymerase sigma-70 factor, ECF subfamily